MTINRLAVIAALSVAFPAARADSIDALAVLLDQTLTIDPTITVNATATGTVTAGKNKKGEETTKKQLEQAQEHAKEYDGPTQFTADYTINFVDGKLDSKTSTVTFTTIYYTAEGKREPEKGSDGFKTLPITITSVTQADGMVTSFSFSATNWYPKDAPLGDEIINNGLSGTINLKTSVSTYKASYQDPDNGAVYSYSVSGKIAANPEPATWIMTLTSFAGLGTWAWRRKHKSRA